jgi:hypothetical protein
MEAVAFANLTCGVTQALNLWRPLGPARPPSGVPTGRGPRGDLIPGPEGAGLTSGVPPGQKQPRKDLGHVKGFTLGLPSPEPVVP